MADVVSAPDTELSPAHEVPADEDVVARIMREGPLDQEGKHFAILVEKVEA